MNSFGANGPPMACFDGLVATDLEEVVDLASDPEALERDGWWALSATFEGAIRGYRFSSVRPGSAQEILQAVECTPGQWMGPTSDSWNSSLNHDQYVHGVSVIRSRIAAGVVYQVNLCRMLSAELPERSNPLALAARLAAGNAAPYQGVLNTGTEWIVTASPELFLSRTGSAIRSSPMKGTAALGEPFTEKDYPENVMITDLVRNDVGRVALPGSVTVHRLAAREDHPGLAHLVSEVGESYAPNWDGPNCWRRRFLRALSQEHRSSRR